ncbi:MAG: ABC transporter permease [Bacillota bacterium]
MVAYLTRRLGQGVLVIVLVTILTFILINVAPGGPSSIMRMESTAEQREALTRQMGLDQPLPVRYGRWAQGVLHGDFGYSLAGGEAVGPLLKLRLVNTVQLALTALTLAVIVGLPLGIWAALRRNTWLDYLINGVSTMGMSLPSFWLGIMAIMVFSVSLNLLPASGMSEMGSGFSLVDRLRHLILPASVLAITITPDLVRFTRSALLEVLGLDFMRTARAKGLSPRLVLLKHGMRNALIPVVAMLGLLLPALLSGSVITESVFGWPGMGRLAVDAATNRDYPVVMAVTVVAGAIIIVTNLGVDLAYSLIDPRIRHD